MKQRIVYVIAMMFAISCGGSYDWNSREPDESQIKGFGDFQGTRLTENQIVAALRRHGVPTSEFGRALCTAKFESNFFTEAQHDNRFERTPNTAGPRSPTGVPLQYFFKAKVDCLRPSADSRVLLTKTCIGIKNDDLKGYKKNPEFIACMDELKKSLRDAREIIAAGGSEAQLKARQCSFDHGLYQINDYWGVYGTYPNGNRAPCSNAINKNMFDLDTNISCMVKMARCGRNSCNFDAWHGYKANKQFCDSYRPGAGFP